MDRLILLAMALPVVFMIHEFEEIVFLRPWMDKNGERLRKQLPVAVSRVLARMSTMTTEKFSLIAAEEFIILSGITFFSVVSDNYYPWFAVLLGFSAHVLMHIMQWIVVRRYIPAIVTSLLALPYCSYAIVISVAELGYTESEIAGCLLMGLAVVGVNLLVMYKLVANYGRGKVTCRPKLRRN